MTCSTATHPSRSKGMALTASLLLWAALAAIAPLPGSAVTPEKVDAPEKTDKTAKTDKPAKKSKKPAAAPATGNSSFVGPDNILTTSSLLTTYRQIVVEGLVVEVASTEARQWGIEAFYQRNPANLDGGGNLAGSILSAPNSFPLGGVPSLNTGVNPPQVTVAQDTVGMGATLDGFQTDNYLFQTRVRAAVIKGKANILSQPIAVTRSGQEVLLKTVDEIPFQDIVTEGSHVTRFSNASNNLAVFNDYAKKDAGITLKVKPTLLPPERIQLDVTTLDVGQLAGFVQVRGIARPILEHSQLATKVELANNESLLISGIKTTSEVSERRGIPVLKDLPVLGLLFGSNTVRTERVDILFMITPHLLAPGENPLFPREFTNRDFIVAK